MHISWLYITIKGHHIWCNDPSSLILLVEHNITFNESTMLSSMQDTISFSTFGSPQAMPKQMETQDDDGS